MPRQPLAQELHGAESNLPRQIPIFEGACISTFKTLPGVAFNEPCFTIIIFMSTGTEQCATFRFPPLQKPGLASAHVYIHSAYIDGSIF